MHWYARPGAITSIALLSALLQTSRASAMPASSTLRALEVSLCRYVHCSNPGCATADSLEAHRSRRYPSNAQGTDTTPKSDRCHAQHKTRVAQ